MFAKTVSIWRQLVGHPAPQADESVALHDDRRVWVRYATELQGNVQLANKQDKDQVLALVRDLSLGGANLLVDREMHAGQMLTLELPAEGDEVRTVLACVVRVVPEDDGKWSLGCVFSRELGQDELGQFGARKIPTAADDQRTWIRFASSLKASYRRVGDAAGVAHPARVLDVSATGIGLCVQPSLEAGALVNVDLHDKTGRTVRTMLACVVHTTQRSEGDYAVGCNFIRELDEDELHSLL